MNKLPNKITISWSTEDVKNIASDLNDNECRQVLQLAENGHDASIGINWDILETWADMVRNDRGNN